MEDRRDVPAGPEPDHDVPVLGDRGVGEDLLDLPLDDAHRGGQQRGHATDQRDDRQRRRRERVEAVHPGDEIDPGRDHGGGVDERRNGGRPLHGIGQPGVQRELGRFADDTAQDEQPDDREPGLGTVAERPDRGLAGEGGFRDGREGALAGEPGGFEGDQYRDGADQEEVIAEPRDEERLLRGAGGAVLAEPEADEQPRAQADELEEDERHQQVVRQRERQHREREQREPGVIPGQAGLALVVHVAEAVDEHQQRDQRDDHEHQRGERIEEHAEGEIEHAVSHDPGVEGLVGVLSGPHGEHDPDREQQRGCEGDDPGDRAVTGQQLGREVAQQHGDQERGERQQRDGGCEVEGAYHLTTSWSRPRSRPRPRSCGTGPG